MIGHEGVLPYRHQWPGAATDTLMKVNIRCGEQTVLDVNEAPLAKAVEVPDRDTKALPGV